MIFFKNFYRILILLDKTLILKLSYFGFISFLNSTLSSLNTVKVWLKSVDSFRSYMEKSTQNNTCSRILPENIESS